MVKINGQEFLLGCDPETFVLNHNKFICAGGLVEGSKEAPQKIKGGMVQVDGMALEFGIDPVKTEDGFVNRTTNVMRRVKKMLPKGYEINTTFPAVTFSDDVLDAAPDECKILGCDPDYNAYTGALNPVPDGKVKFRTTAGHIHVGWTKDVDPNDPTHFMACRMLATAMDYWVGLPSLMWDSTPESVKRRELYGKAGAFRPKPYGMEYRTLSCRWLMHPDLTRFVYKATVKAIHSLYSGKCYLEDDRTRKVINESNKNVAFMICKREDNEPPKPPREFKEAMVKEREVIGNVL